LHTAEPTLHPDTVRLLHAYPWPGNIRELENTIHRALLVCDGNVLLPSHLNLPHIKAETLSAEAKQFIADNCPLEKVFAQMLATETEELHDFVMRKLTVQAYEHSNQNQVQAAKLLGISRNVLRTQLKNFGIIE
jgi:sigma-54-specific transcriptional regulator